MCPSQTAEPIEMPFEANSGGPKEALSDEVEIPHEKGQYWGVVQRESSPVKGFGRLCCGLASERDHSVVNNGSTADCNAPDWSVLLSHCPP